MNSKKTNSTKPLHTKAKHSNLIDPDYIRQGRARLLQTPSHLIPIIIVGVIVVFLAIFAIVNFSQIQQEASQTGANDDTLIQRNAPALQADNEQNASGKQGWRFADSNWAHLSTIADPTTPEIISVTNEDGDSSYTLTDESKQAIENALSPFTAADVPVGFLLVNCNTGYGIAYNIDTPIYGASTFKGSYAFYICQTWLETGNRSLDDYIDYFEEDPYAETFDFAGTAQIRDVIYECIVDSDNSAFVSLRESFDGEEFDRWLESYDVVVDQSNNPWFPTYSVRDAAKLWAGLYEYLQSDTELSQWYKGLLQNTDMSFLRVALKDYRGIEIADKAGWYAEVDEDEKSLYDSVSDLGIITYEDTDYLFCIMTGASYDGTSENNFEILANTIFSARDQLEK